MLVEYLNAAMRLAEYELEDGAFYGSIAGFQGVLAHAPTLEACRTQLLEVLEGWIIVGLRHGHALPVVDGINLNLQEAS